MSQIYEAAMKDIEEIKKTRSTSVKVYGKTAIKLRELSAKRKRERNVYRTQEEILAQLIDQAYKREVK